MLLKGYITTHRNQIKSGYFYTKWSKLCPTLTFDDFIEGLNWLTDDEMTDGKMRRELGCHPKKGVIRMRRAYADDGSFYGFYSEDGKTLNPHSDGQNALSINVRDNLLL